MFLKAAFHQPAPTTFLKNGIQTTRCGTELVSRSSYPGKLEEPCWLSIVDWRFSLWPLVESTTFFMGSLGGLLKAHGKNRFKYPTPLRQTSLHLKGMSWMFSGSGICLKFSTEKTLGGVLCSLNPFLKSHEWHLPHHNNKTSDSWTFNISYVPTSLGRSADILTFHVGAAAAFVPRPVVVPMKPKKVR